MKPASFDNLSFVIGLDHVIQNYNKPAKETFPKIEKGCHCYEAMRGYSSPCPDCPIYGKDGKGNLLYNVPGTDKKYYASFSNITLNDGSDGYIVSASESDYEKDKRDFEIDQLLHKAEIFRKANYNCAYCYFDVNLTKNLLTSDLVEVVDEVEYKLDMTTRGFTYPIKFTDYTKWFHDLKVISDKEEYEDMTNREKLIERYNQGITSASLIFRARSTSGYLTWHKHSIYMYKVKGNDDLFAIYVLRDIAFKVINEDNTRKNEDIVRILANEYATVLYVDVLTGVVSSCKLPKSWDASLKKDISDKPFTEVWRKYIKLYVKNSDAEKMSKLLDKEYMTQYFENKTNLSFVFRMGTESEFKYYELKVVKANEGDLKALVVGMADKDEEIRSANEMQKQLETALVLAQNDALTNVRNRTGYDMCERQINAELEKGNADGFAVIMFDVNGLKMVNDAYGHDKGDQMLINACKIICDVFKHSSVFRLGGDEFVAVVRGKDYDKCNSLLQKLRDIVTENEEKDGPAYENVSMASGMAIYNPKIDKYVYDVFMRADEAMYENKNHMKVLRAKRNLQRRNRG